MTVVRLMRYSFVAFIKVNTTIIAAIITHLYVIRTYYYIITCVYSSIYLAWWVSRPRSVVGSGIGGGRSLRIIIIICANEQFNNMRRGTVMRWHLPRRIFRGRRRWRRLFYYRGGETILMIGFPARVGLCHRSHYTRQWFCAFFFRLAVDPEKLLDSIT